jgi:hypothetical protein
MLVLLIASSSPLRLSLLTLLSWLAFPLGFLMVPAANQLVLVLDLYNQKLIDFVVSALIAIVGYIQWFWLVPLLRRAFR